MKHFVVALLLVVLTGTSHAAVLVQSANGSWSSAFTNLSTAKAAPGAKAVLVTTPQVLTAPLDWTDGPPLDFSPGAYVTYTGAGALTGLKKAKAEWFGVLDGVADEVQINAALDSMRDQLGGTLDLFGLYNIESSIIMSRGLRAIGDSMESTKIVNSGNTPAFVFRKHGSANPLFTAIENLQIEGTDDPADTGNHGIQCAGAAQYASIRNVNIRNMGGTSLLFDDTDSDGVTPLFGDLNGASGSRGMLYSTFDNVLIEHGHSYGIYMTGNSAQNTFIKARIKGMQGSTGIKFISNNLGANVLANTFIGGGVESGGDYTDASVFNAVWFDDGPSSLYAAYNTKFINFYLEPGVSVANAASGVTGYLIEAASGVDINGGYVSFVHEGINATTTLAENVVVSNVLFFNSDTFNGAANLAGKYAINKTNSGASVILGPGNKFQDSTSGSAWGIINPAQAVLGFDDLENDFENSIASSMRQKGTSARMIGTATGGASTVLLRSYAADNTTETTRLAVTGGTDVATVNLATSNLQMSGTDTGGAQGRIIGVHSLNFNARTSANVGNSHLFVDSADNKLKFKDSSGVVNLLY